MVSREVDVLVVQAFTKHAVLERNVEHACIIGGCMEIQAIAMVQLACFEEGSEAQRFLAALE
jgi:hypothetical protein